MITDCIKIIFILGCTIFTIYNIIKCIQVIREIKEIKQRTKELRAQIDAMRALSPKKDT